MASTFVILNIISVLSAGCSIGAALMVFNIGQPSMPIDLSVESSSTGETIASMVTFKYRGVEYQRLVH